MQLKYVQTIKNALFSRVSVPKLFVSRVLLRPVIYQSLAVFLPHGISLKIEDETTHIKLESE